LSGGVSLLAEGVSKVEGGSMLHWLAGLAGDRGLLGLAGARGL